MMVLVSMYRVGGINTCSIVSPVTILRAMGIQYILAFMTTVSLFTDSMHTVGNTFFWQCYCGVSNSSHLVQYNGQRIIYIVMME